MRIREVFFELLRAGLWESPAHVASFMPIDWNELYSLVNQQAVMGFVTAGISHIDDEKVAKVDTRQFIIDAGGIVARNGQMNDYIASLMRQFEEKGISAVLIKGQGIAQYYERPLWRSCGDVDLLLDSENYEKAKAYLTPNANRVEEDVERKHLSLKIGSFTVELHGTIRSLKNPRIDRVLDSVLSDMFKRRDFLLWNNNGVEIATPAPDINIIIIFTHILQHFFSGGIGIRQVCDWCRLLWVFKEKIDIVLLEERLREMRIITEWKAFGSFAFNYLGYPCELMPFYDSSYKKKADRLARYILRVGNFGHNLDRSYIKKYPYPIRKTISFCRQITDFLQHMRLFPLDAIRYFYHTFIIGITSVIKGR